MSQSQPDLFKGHPPPHYDTTRLPADELAKARESGRRQEQRVAEHFRMWPLVELTREDVERRFGLPTQSASRVLANLTGRRIIEKTIAAGHVSSYGKRCHAWRLRLE